MGADSPSLPDRTSCGCCRDAEVIEGQLRDEIERLRAGVSWARGMCTDESSLVGIDVFLGRLLDPRESDEEDDGRA